MARTATSASRQGPMIIVATKGKSLVPRTNMSGKTSFIATSHTSLYDESHCRFISTNEGFISHKFHIRKPMLTATARIRRAEAIVSTFTQKKGVSSFVSTVGFTSYNLII
jgi:hypothetical protein